ncbi:HNH endonuclease [Peribacillus butanolivorans]|uniref:HNH endonuclease n=1 Tax=Peribacillus butanolivorans TaxID=421767 RepID=UPI00366AD47B
MTLHLILKFPVDYSIAGGTTDTITEHKQLCEAKNRLIWGQGSQRTSEGVSDKNKRKLIDQISNGVNTYTLFLANNKGNRELYVGKMTNIYGRGKIPIGSPLTQFIPNYYASTVGTATDQNNVFVDVCTFFRVDDKYIGDITLEKNGDRVIDVRNSSSIFFVNITEDLEKLLIEMLTNPESNFQYQVEQEVVPDAVTVADKPKSKPFKTSGSGTSSYKRDPKTSKTAIVTAKFKCEIDDTHEEFISRVTGKNYVEAHHLIPMEYQDDYTNRIDVEANIVSLCVCCHKKLHHGTSAIIKPIIEKLYDDRKGRLKDCDIELTKTKLFSYYD